MKWEELKAGLEKEGVDSEKFVGYYNLLCMNLTTSAVDYIYEDAEKAHKKKVEQTKREVMKVLMDVVDQERLSPEDRKKEGLEPLTADYEFTVSDEVIKNFKKKGVPIYEEKKKK